MSTYALEAKGTRRMKVGQTFDVAARTAALQVGCPVRLRLIASTPQDIEAQLHGLLRKWHIHGEWFALNTKSQAIVLERMRTPLMNACNIGGIAMAHRTSKGLVGLQSNNGLSSRDPTSKVIGVRLPANLLMAVEAACEAHGLTQSELIRGLVSQWASGQSQLSGPDAGYAQARSMASQLAHVIVRKAMNEALQNAIAELPESPDAATTMLQGYYADRSEHSKR